MKSTLKKALAAGITLKAVIVLILLVAVGCKNSTSIEMGPADVVDAFNRAITGGDFNQARQLCDTASMKDYLESYQEAWEVIQAEDSSALSIASSILEKAVIDIEDIQKEGEKRIVLYTLEADGHSKTRKATVKKEEGAWRVEKKGNISPSVTPPHASGDIPGTPPWGSSSFIWDYSSLLGGRCWIRVVPHPPWWQAVAASCLTNA